MKLTDEQNLILSSFRGAGNIKIFAFAGTGKTTTLKAIAGMYPQARILYLAFNKSIEREARGKFGKNVEVRTIHSLAYKFVGRDYEIQNLNPAVVAEMFDIDYQSAYEVINAFEEFCNGDYLSFDEVNSSFATYARLVYEKMKNKEIPANHSFYLKEFHLKLVRGEIKLRYDIVLLDEAQDTNPVTFEVFKLIEANKKAVVGDRHQQIYAFRGAVNALSRFDGDEFYLTNSFRFNENIAKNATYFLRVWKSEVNSIKGLNKQSKINSKAILSRTNSYLIEKTAQFIKDEVKFKFVREPYSVFGLALNLLRLKNGDELDKQFSYLSRFDYKELLELSESDEFSDVELKTAINVVEKYNKALVGYYMKAKEYFYDKSLKAEYFLSTAHTSKGLEWDEVTLLEDFNNLYRRIAALMNERNIKDIEPYYFIKAIAKNNYQGLAELENEANLFYVAYTRARVKVINLSDVSFIQSKINMEIQNLID